MSDACGCGDDAPRPGAAEAGEQKQKQEPERLWEVGGLAGRAGHLPPTPIPAVAERRLTVGSAR